MFAFVVSNQCVRMTGFCLVNISDIVEIASKRNNTNEGI